jgi:hypothetical protein
VTHNILQGDGGGFFITPPLVFHVAILQSALADDDTVRDADQFKVGEHDAGALVAVIQQHFDT